MTPSVLLQLVERVKTIGIVYLASREFHNTQSIRQRCMRYPAISPIAGHHRQDLRTSCGVPGILNDFREAKPPQSRLIA